MAAKREEDFNKHLFISATMVSGLPRSLSFSFVFFAFVAILKKIHCILAVSATVLS